MAYFPSSTEPELEMSADDFFDDEIDTSDDDQGSDYYDFDGMVNSAKGKKRKALDARRRIELLLEQRRMREMEQDYF